MFDNSGGFTNLDNFLRVCESFSVNRILRSSMIKYKIIGGLILWQEKRNRYKMTEGKRNIIRQLLEEYDIESAQDIQDALKDLIGRTIKEMMEA